MDFVGAFVIGRLAAAFAGFVSSRSGGIVWGGEVEWRGLELAYDVY